MGSKQEWTALDRDPEVAEVGGHKFHDPMIAALAAVAHSLDARMASSQDWTEFNGASAATLTLSRTEMNWKSVDDSTTAYSASNAVIPAGSNSMSKYQALRFTGAWNSLSAFTYKLSTLNPLDNASGSSTRIAIAASVITTTSALTTPTTTATGDPTTTANFTNGTGVAAGFATSSGVTGVSASTATSPGTTTIYAQALRTQLQTQTTAAPGDLASVVTVTATWTES